MTDNTDLNQAPLNPARIARLSRGLIMTLRSLNGRSGDWDVSVSKTLAIQRFFKEFDAWIKELDGLQAPIGSDTNEHKNVTDSMPRQE